MVEGCVSKQLSNKKDPAWKYNYLKDAKDPISVTCIFCDKITKGGIFHAKLHQVGNSKNVVACKNWPQDVKEELENYMNEKKLSKAKSYGYLPDFDDGSIQDDVGEEDDVAQVYVCKGVIGRSKDGESVKKKAKVATPQEKGPMDLFLIKKAEKKCGKLGETSMNDVCDKEARA